MFVTAGSAVTICNVTTTTAYPNDGAWHHVAWVYDDTLGSANGKIYIDRTLAGSANGANTNSAANPSYTLSIGETGGGALPFNGLIDDLRIASSTYTIEVPAAPFIDGYVLTPATSIQANQGSTGFIPGYYVPATSTEAHQSGGAAITFTQTLSAGAGSGTVELLCHFDGSDGSTTLVDSSTFGNTLTATACALDTDIKKFGTASLLANDYAGVVDITATNAIGSSAWCIEGFVYIDAIQGRMPGLAGAWRGNGCAIRLCRIRVSLLILTRINPGPGSTRTGNCAAAGR